MGFKEKIKQWSEEGIRLPMAHDGTTGKPSVTLLFVYVAYIIAASIVIYLTVKDQIAGSAAALMFFFGCLIMYRIRHLDKIKVDLDDKSFDIEDNTSSKEN